MNECEIYTHRQECESSLLPVVRIGSGAADVIITGCLSSSSAAVTLERMANKVKTEVFIRADRKHLSFVCKQTSKNNNPEITNSVELLEFLPKPPTPENKLLLLPADT